MPQSVFPLSSSSSSFVLDCFPHPLAALVLEFMSNLFSSLTHYGSGRAPVIFGSGYVELGTWGKLGALTGVVNIMIWLLVGGL